MVSRERQSGKKKRTGDRKGKVEDPCKHGSAILSK
jgi:hypothetical protein